MDVDEIYRVPISRRTAWTVTVSGNTRKVKFMLCLEQMGAYLPQGKPEQCVDIDIIVAECIRAGCEKRSCFAGSKDIIELVPVAPTEHLPPQDPFQMFSKEISRKAWQCVRACV